LSKAMQGEVVLNRDQRETRIEKASAEAMSQAAQILNLSLVFFSTRNETPVTFNSQTTKSQSLLLQIATNPKLPIKSRQLAFNTIAISLDESENAKLFEKEIWKLASGFTESQLETFVLSLSLSRWDSTRSVRLSAVLRLIKLPQFTERVQIALISAMGSAVSSNLCRQIDALAVFSAMHKQDRLTVDATDTMFKQFELWADAQDVFDLATHDE
uniref:hypothetical protein n=1 Tax=Roseimaritima sediminicola TaxID=2662066 RepID=UPI001386AD26